MEKYVCKAHDAFIVAHPILNILGAYIATILAGVVIYYLVEKPCNKLLKNL